MKIFFLQCSKNIFLQKWLGKEKLGLRKKKQSWFDIFLSYLYFNVPTVNMNGRSLSHFSLNMLNDHSIGSRSNSIMYQINRKKYLSAVLQMSLHK